MQYYGLLQSLDNLKLAWPLGGDVAKHNAILPTLLEINISGEESKYELSAANEDQWEVLIPILKEL